MVKDIIVYTTCPKCGEDYRDDCVHNCIVDKIEKVQSLKSSLLETPSLVAGTDKPLHTQIFFFESGNKKTYKDLDLTTLNEGTFTKIRCTKGYWVSIKSSKLECFESHPQK